MPPPAPKQVLKIPPPPKLGAQGICFVVMLTAALVAMGGDWVPPDLTFSTLLAVSLVSRFITIAQAAAGYGNTGLLTVMALYIVAEGITQTGGECRVFSGRESRTAEAAANRTGGADHGGLRSP